LIQQQKKNLRQSKTDKLESLFHSPTFFDIFHPSKTLTHRKYFINQNRQRRRTRRRKTFANDTTQHQTGEFFEEITKPELVVYPAFTIQKLPSLNNERKKK
jgi:hypothetical protein